MKILSNLVIGALLFTPIAYSGESHQYEGAWNINMVTPKGKDRKGLATLTSQGGTWDIEHTNVKNPCKGRPAPVYIIEATSDALVFEVRKSESLRGCNDFTATLKPVSENTLEGESDDGRKIKLMKK